MTLKNFLIVVNDIEVSKAFYKALFGLQVVTDFGENAILSGGLVLQEKTSWETLIGKTSAMGDGCTALYFEETDLDGFVRKVEESAFSVKWINVLTEYECGKKVVRLYDPDGHLVEVGTPI